MFTGIIEEIGRVKEIIKGSLSIKLSINCSKILVDVKRGDSVAVNGICLTVVEKTSTSFTVDVMPETMRKSGLSSLNISDRVNLERALKVSDRFGGHIVSGHIDGTGIIIEKTSEDNAIWLTVETSADIIKYIINKGSVTLEGTSLTVAKVMENSFGISLIPLTAGFTTLGAKKKGDLVNIECDIIGKYVERLLNAKDSYRQPSNQTNNVLSIDFLRENGFA